MSATIVTVAIALTIFGIVQSQPPTEPPISGAALDSARSLLADINTLVDSTCELPTSVSGCLFDSDCDSCPGAYTFEEPCLNDDTKTYRVCCQTNGCIGSVILQPGAGTCVCYPPELF